MITYIDSKNQEQYNKLFAAAQEDLKSIGKNATIDSLESYFTYIEELSGMNKEGFTHYGRKYTILPIQEEYFEIDANSRSITVPEVFRKNGLGVQGDNTAETIYFRINRYYDAMDLNTTDIYIQWENSDGEPGFSKEWVRDIYTYDDYLVFGWVLGDTMINKPGTIKFSVRFIKTKGEGDQKVVQYSLSTLTAQALVNPGLDFDINTVVYRDDLNALLASNFENTTTKTDSEIQKFAFVYDFNNLITENNVEDNIILADLVDDKIEFLISAYADKGTLKYNMYKQLNDTLDVANDTLISNMEIVAKTAKDTLYSADKAYYVLSEGKYERISAIPGLEEGATITSDSYYELYGRYELTLEDKTEGMPLTGLYYGTAIVEMADGSETSPRVTIHKVKLLPPTATVVKNADQVTGYATEGEIAPEFDAVENNILTYHWQKKADGEFGTDIATSTSYRPTEQAEYKFFVTSTRNGDSVDSNEHLYYVTTPPAEDDIAIEIPNKETSIGATFRARVKYAPPVQLEGTKYSVSFMWKDEDGNEYGSGTTAFDNGEYVNNTPAAKAIIGKNYYCTVTATYNDISVEKISTPSLATE